MIMLNLFLMVLHLNIVHLDLLLEIFLGAGKFLQELLHHRVLLINFVGQCLLNCLDFVMNWSEVCFKESHQFLVNSGQDFIFQMLDIRCNCAGVGGVTASICCDADAISIASLFPMALFRVSIVRRFQIVLDCLCKQNIDESVCFGRRRSRVLRGSVVFHGYWFDVLAQILDIVRKCLVGISCVNAVSYRVVRIWDEFGILRKKYGKQRGKIVIKPLLAVVKVALGGDK